MDSGDAVGLIFLILVVGTLCFFSGRSNGYKTGQIEALNGHFDYELITAEDQSVSWEKIKREK